MVDHKTGKPLPFGSLGVHKVHIRIYIVYVYGGGREGEKEGGWRER